MASYDARIGRAFPGMVANSRPGDGVTCLVEDNNGAGFGVALFQGASDMGATKTPSVKPLGITPSDPTLVSRTTVDIYEKGKNCTAKRGGVIWVTNGAAAVVKGDPVYVTPAGAFTNVTGGGANFAFGRSVFDSSAAAAGLVKIEINLA